MQFAGQGKPPVGIVYITPMNRPDAALALALLYGLEGKREARTAAVAVCGGSLGAAAYCDVLLRFYLGSGQFLNSNRILPVGLATEGDLPADSPAVKVVLDKAPAREIRLVSDTSEVRAMIRNALTGQVNGNAVIVLSADPTELMRTLALPGVVDLVKAKVKTLVVVDPVNADVLKGWPTPIARCGREIGEALPYPAASIEKDYSWSPAHPVADFYRASGTMPFDAPTQDMAAILYAVRPDTFQLSDQKALTIPLAQKQKILETYIELASAKPVPRGGRRRDQPPPAQTPPAKKTP